MHAGFSATIPSLESFPGGKWTEICGVSLSSEIEENPPKKWKALGYPRANHRLGTAPQSVRNSLAALHFPVTCMATEAGYLQDFHEAKMCPGSRAPNPQADVCF